MLIGGTENLKTRKEVVNSLNVFPVPDGDTGTNMTLTMTSAVAKLGASSGGVGSVSQTVSKGSLMGARGNSGVILSQIFRGLANGLKDLKDMNVKDFCGALMHAKNSAYSAVLKPVEGTMLTVIKDIAEGVKGSHKKKISFEELFENIMRIAQGSLANTPNLLPVLKQAGVVDSGGQGLVYFFAGMQDVLLGKEIEITETAERAPANAQMHFDSADIKYLYCTEFILNVDRQPEVSFRERLEEMGDSLVYVQDENLLKVHVHTNNPGEVLEMGLRHGELVTIKIENMKEQHNHIVEDAEKYSEPSSIPEEHEQLACAFIAVASGSGIKAILSDFGVDYVIEGGQTMNPSTSDFVEAINMLGAKEVVLFPNNGNIIMAAQQAREICGEHVHVVPTKTLPQCITAIISYDEGVGVEENVQTMCDAIRAVKTVSVTHSIRETELDGFKIAEGDYIAVLDKGIAAVGTDVADVARDAVIKCADDDSSLITIYTGNGVDADSTEKLRAALEHDYPNVDISVFAGDQPVYYYIISVE